MQEGLVKEGPDLWVLVGSQHVFRVAGAQHVVYIQLLGRWGSSSVLRYVQEAAVMLPGKASGAVSLHVSHPSSSSVSAVSRPCPTRLTAPVAGRRHSRLPLLFLPELYDYLQ